MDGTDFRIQEPIPFDRKWYSHKFSGAGLRYEVGVCIQTGHIVWANGPYEAGAWSDRRISLDKIVYELDDEEMVLADGGYNDDYEFFETPTGHNDEDQRMKKVARARHETINGKLKTWGILKQCFRHNLNKHWMVFAAAIHITQLLIETEDDYIFQVDYNDVVDEEE